MEDQQSLLQPLLHEKPTTPLLTSNDLNILVRFVSVIFIGLLALYANHEASKGFDITIINDAKDSVAGQRFHLLYVADDKATRIILNASNFVEHLLYNNNNHPKKHITHVVLRLSTGLNDTSSLSDHFVLQISPSIMAQANTNHALVTAILRGMARVWLWDGRARAPRELVDGMVEYVRIVAQGSFGDMKSYGIGAKMPECDKFWWKNKEPQAVAQMLNYWEGHSKGFIQRLNGGMKEKWHDRMVDDALGMPLQKFCGL